MDVFAEKVRAAFEVLRESLRGTGRTTRMVEELDSNAVVVFPTAAAGVVAKRLAKEKYGKLLKYAVSNPQNGLAAIFSATWGASRVVLSHEWLEEYYAYQLAQIERELESFNAQYGPSHEKDPDTGRRANASRSHQSEWLFGARAYHAAGETLHPGEHPDVLKGTEEPGT